MQRWAGRPIWLRSAEASVERWSPPFCGIRTSVVCWLSNQSVGSPVPRQKKRAGYGVLGCSLLQPLCVCVCVCVCVSKQGHTKVGQSGTGDNQMGVGMGMGMGVGMVWFGLVWFGLVGRSARDGVVLSVTFSLRRAQRSSRRASHRPGEHRLRPKGGGGGTAQRSMHTQQFRALEV